MLITDKHFNILSALYKKLDYRFLLISLIHFFITTYTDSIIFASVDYMASKKYFAIKFLALFCLVTFWQFVLYAFHKIRNKDENMILFLKCFGVYFAIMLFFLILTWPGVWRWDDLHVLSGARNLKFLYWQHWLTGFFYMFSLAIIPFPGGIVFMQIFIISLIVGYISYLICKTFSTKFKYVLYIPMLLPAVIDNNLYPLRPTLCAYLELLILSLILFKWYDKSSVKTWEMIFLGMLTAIMATWRSESIIYLIIIPAILFVSFKKRIQFKAALCFAAVTLIISSSVIFIQQGASDKRSKEQMDYKLTAMLSSLSAILQTNFNSDNPEKDIEVINKIINVDSLKEKDGIAVFWQEGVRENYTPENYNAFQNVYVKLVSRNIPVFFKNQFRIFKSASGMKRDAVSTLGYSPELFRQTGSGSYDVFRDVFIFNRPLSDPLRGIVIEMLECRKHNDYYKTTFLYGLVYNIVYPLTVIVAVSIYALCRKKWLIMLVGGTIIIKACLVFVTSPAVLFMYYFSTYVCAYSLGIIGYLMMRDKKANVGKKSAKSSTPA